MVYAEPKLLLKSSPAGVRTSADASDAEENMPLRSAADGGAETGVKWHMAGAPLAPALHIGMEPVIEWSASLIIAGFTPTSGAPRGTGVAAGLL